MAGPMNNSGVSGVIREAWNSKATSKTKKTPDEKFPKQPSGRMTHMPSMKK